jgi:3-phenylpropionate/trans-cinnamate dioxygenase ferredoxin reductase subunit
LAEPGVVIVGAGHAGGSVAAFLRQYGYAGAITIIGEEPIAPYQRPPLSKAWLKGEADAETLMLRPESFYAENDIALRLDTVVKRIDRDARVVHWAGGGQIPYHHLILATGSRARRIPLPGLELGGVLELRTAADADRLKAALGPGKRLAVIGGGYIGLEAAASARALGAEAVVIEREARVLARVACEALSTFFQDYHTAHGVRFVLGAGVEAIVGADGQAAAVKLAGGALIEADAFLVGVGAVPNQELAQAAGLHCSEGIVVDLEARTSDPAIFAIGDCTRRPMPIYGHRTHRLESVPNALEQAKQAASAITGRAAPAGEVPWFWSDQYDLKLQIAGLPFDADRIVIRGEPHAGKDGGARFAVFHLDAENRIQAVEAINAGPEFMAGRQLIGQRKPVAPDKLRDMSISMKEVAA